MTLSRVSVKSLFIEHTLLDFARRSIQSLCGLRVQHNPAPYLLRFQHDSILYPNAIDKNWISGSVWIWRPGHRLFDGSQNPVTRSEVSRAFNLRDDCAPRI